jgi:hypothetical protein
LDLRLSGRVYDASIGPTGPIAGAVVSVQMCVPRAFQTVSGPDGEYSILLPWDWLGRCTEVTLHGWASGYQGRAEVISVASLRVQPVRDIPLFPVGWSTPTVPGVPTSTPLATVTPVRQWLYLPAVFRQFR